MNDITTQRTPEIIVVEINNIKDQTRKMFLYNSIEIGRRLVEAKSLIEHGEWSNWLQQSVDYSQSTANNLMRIFEEYGNDQQALFGNNAKSQTLGNLSYTQAVALLGIPPEEREAFVQEHDVANMSTRSLQQAIKEKTEALIQLEQYKQLAENKEKEVKKLQEEKDDALGCNKDLITERDEILQKMRELQDNLKEAQAAGNDEEVTLLKESFKEAEKDLSEQAKKIEELEKQLKEQPIEAQAVSVVEKVPEDVEKELNELRANMQNQQNNEAIIKYKLHFNSLVKIFNELLSSLEDIKVQQPNEHEKYKNAIAGLISKMNERL